MKAEFMESLRRLKNETGVGLLDCKKALKQANGSIDDARKILREEGILDSLVDNQPDIKREGILGSYTRGNISSMVELNCEHPSTSKDKQFIEFANKLCLHIVGYNPRYMNRNEIPFSEIKLQEELYRRKYWKDNEDETQKEVKRLMENEYYPEMCLLLQPFCSDKLTVEESLVKLGEELNDKITINRFVRWYIA
jgi:elongation factor Ts